MRYQVLASDYDGTLATDGRVDRSTLIAVRKLLASGRRLVLVTGRELPELLQIFPHLDLCEWVVAENGALLYQPATRNTIPLAESPPRSFVQRLRRRGVRPLSAGRVIIATSDPHQQAVREVIREMGLELQLIFNKDSLMVLPTGIDKATGLTAALERMNLSSDRVVGVGDAENDHALLQMCAYSVAVANALPQLQQIASFVTAAEAGTGVAELIDRLITTDS